MHVPGPADGFAVLGATTVTNTGGTVITGDLGVSAGTSITGFLPGVVNGNAHVSDAATLLAQQDALAEYAAITDLTVTTTVTSGLLGNLTLTPGVFSFASSAGLTGPLTLDFGGANNEDFVFQIGSTLTTASDSSVTVLNRGLNDNIYWQVGSSATLGTYSTMQGYVLAAQSVTLTTGASISCGGATALNGAVTLDTNSISLCDASSGGGGPVDPPADGGPGVSTVPEPGGLSLLGMGVLGLAGMLRRRRAA